MNGVKREMGRPGGQPQRRVFVLRRRWNAAPQAQDHAQQGEGEDRDARRDVKVRQEQLGLGCRAVASPGRVGRDDAVVQDELLDHPAPR